MRALGVLATFSFLLMLTAAACGGGKDKPAPSVPVGNDGDGGADGECVDEDGDGFGTNCEQGRDCDDSDPDVTDECRRCAGAIKDCPCKPGTKAMSCTPAPKRQDGGTLVCKEGNRYCRDGYWSDCEALYDYVFVPD